MQVAGIMPISSIALQHAQREYIEDIKYASMK